MFVAVRCIGTATAIFRSLKYLRDFDWERYRHRKASIMTCNEKRNSKKSSIIVTFLGFLLGWLLDLVHPKVSFPKKMQIFHCLRPTKILTLHVTKRMGSNRARLQNASALNVQYTQCLLLAPYSSTLYSPQSHEV